MQVEEGKAKFIEAWGKMAGEWGINRTMAQVHALLMISPESLSADEVMQQLDISRGNANMNIRALMDWGLVHKQLRSGERREYFYAERDMWTVVKQIMLHRKKKELEPMLKVLEEVGNVEPQCPHSQRFSEVVRDIQIFSVKANQTLDALIKADSNWFSKVFIRLVR
jgi:DNA-binding transcriptional regulator GbsR (MarR family)